MRLGLATTHDRQPDRFSVVERVCCSWFDLRIVRAFFVNSIGRRRLKDRTTYTNLALLLRNVTLTLFIFEAKVEWPKSKATTKVHVHVLNFFSSEQLANPWRYLANNSATTLSSFGPRAWIAATFPSLPMTAINGIAEIPISVAIGVRNPRNLGSSELET